MVVHEQLFYTVVGRSNTATGAGYVTVSCVSPVPGRAPTWHPLINRMRSIGYHRPVGYGGQPVAQRTERGRKSYPAATVHFNAKGND